MELLWNMVKLRSHICITYEAKKPLDISCMHKTARNRDENDDLKFKMAKVDIN